MQLKDLERWAKDTTDRETAESQAGVQEYFLRVAIVQANFSLYIYNLPGLLPDTLQLWRKADRATRSSES